MSIKLTGKQLELLVTAINNRVIELKDTLNPLLTELAEHEHFLNKYGKEQLTPLSVLERNSAFELLPWSKKICRVILELDKFMTTNEIVSEIINRIPELANETSTRSSVASILSRRSGKLFRKVGDKYGLIEWGNDKI